MSVLQVTTYGHHICIAFAYCIWHACTTWQIHLWFDLLFRSQLSWGSKCKNPILQWVNRGGKNC